MAFPIEKFQSIRTPFYYYDMEVLDATLQEIKRHLKSNYHMHYAVKACTNADVLKHIAEAGFGCDCVSGGEIEACLAAGINAKDIVFAGVGKSDWEIDLGLKAGIGFFNVESIPELEVINDMAKERNTVAHVSFRINPNVGAHTHANITTGLAENKFGIDMEDMVEVIRMAGQMSNVEFMGLHFHIGSQLLVMDDFIALCHRVNELQDKLEAEGIRVPNINVGGGLGIDYQDPDGHPIPDFEAYFKAYNDNLKLREGQHLHFECGRAVVGQCGSLISKVLFVKKGHVKQFAIIDAGMTDLIRPALYDAYHLVQNITSPENAPEKYDVVGPICESSDVFVKEHTMPAVKRGDLVALRSAGAYGEIMASQYNCRRLPQGISSEKL